LTFIILRCGTDFTVKVIIKVCRLIPLPSGEERKRVLSAVKLATPLRRRGEVTTFQPA